MGPGSKPILKAWLLPWLMIGAGVVESAYGARLTSGEFSGGNFQFIINTSPGSTVAVEAATAINAPGAWTNIGSINPSQTQTAFTDTQATNFNYRFYRAQEGTNCPENAIGFIRLLAPPGLTLIANQLDAGTNTLSRLIPNPPVGTQFYKYVPGLGWQGIYVFDEFDLAWLPLDNSTINPGEGGFLRNNTGTNITITFIGEIVQGNITYQFPAGFSLVASKIPTPTSATPGSFFGCPFRAGDQAYKFTNNGSGGGGYTISTYDEFDLQWDNNFTINIGEAFLLRLNQPYSCSRQFKICN
jgi:hypothetical protein